MANENENLDSQIEEYQPEDVTDLELDALKEKYQSLSEKYKDVVGKNRQLFQRAKKAEGFELREGRWHKPEPRSQEPNPEPKPEAKPKSDDLDFGQLAFYNSKGDVVKVTHDDDIEFLRSTVQETGKSMKDILGSKWFQSELKDRQTAREVVNATPTSTRRGSEGVANQLEIAYTKYIQSGKLPDDPELRIQVVNKRQEHEGRASRFTSESVVG